MDKPKAIFKAARAGWEFIPIWMAANAAGWLVASLVGSAFGAGNPLWLALSGIAGGAILGTCGWLALRRYLHSAGWWVLATAAGFGVGLPLIGIAGGLLESVFQGNALWLVYGLDFAIGGLVAAAPQALFLAGQVRRSGWWLAGSALGWAGGWSVVLASNVVSGASWAYFSTVGAIYGLVTGGVLLWLLTAGRD